MSFPSQVIAASGQKIQQIRQRVHFSSSRTGRLFRQSPVLYSVAGFQVTPAAGISLEPGSFSGMLLHLIISAFNGGDIAVTNAFAKLFLDLRKETVEFDEIRCPD